MKRLLPLWCMVLGTTLSFGQKVGLQPAPSDHVAKLKKRSIDLDQPKTLLCVDTVRYPQVKEQTLGTPNFYTLGIWNSDVESMSQMYIHSGSGLSVTGAEFFGSNDATNGTASITVRARLYNVNGSNSPTGTALATGTVVVSSATPAYYNINFASAVNVTANYAIVIDVSSTNGVLNLYVNDIAPLQPYDENLSRFKSNYYVSSSGLYVPIPTMTDLGGTYDFEGLISPKVSYTINTTASVLPDPVCLGTPVNFSGTATPTNILSNRMYNFNVFSTYFLGATSDSTYVWDTFDPSPLIWSSTATYTYPTAGTYNATMYTLGGFWHSCLDNAVDPVTINALPNVAASAMTNPICEGASTMLMASGAASYSWNNGIGAVTSPMVSPVVTTTYIVTGTDANNCVNTANVSVNVTPLADATFNYASNTICTSSGNQTPVISNPGTFSSAAGLSFVSTSTGEINVGSSTPGVYTVTYTTSGTCPDVQSQSINLTNAPDATFSYSSLAYCTGTANPVPSFGAGASAGTFSSSTGLAFASTGTGEIDLTASTAGTYTVTNTIAAGGGCPSDVQTFNVTINQTPTATVTGGGTVCGDGSTPVPVFVTLTGNGPWSFTYSDGSITSPVVGQTASPYTINATSDGTYTVTILTDGNCAGTISGSANVTFNPNPNVDISPLYQICDNEGLATLNGLPSGGTFSGTGMTGNQFDPAMAPGIYTVTYSYTDPGTGCSGSATNNIEVHAAPSVTFDIQAVMCLQDGPLTLQEGTPTGGAFSGTDVSGSTLTPSAAGSYTVTYSYTDLNSCTGSANGTIEVNDCAGIEELTSLNITVSPNPATDAVMINVENAQSDVVYSIWTEDGRIVVAPTSISNGTETIKVINFASGVYFVNFNSENGTMIKKLIIQ